MSTTTAAIIRRRNWLIVLSLEVLLVVLPILGSFSPMRVWQSFQVFVTIFLGIFIEATPFLLAGAIVSGLLAEFVEPAWLQRIAPRRPLVAASLGDLRRETPGALVMLMV